MISSGLVGRGGVDGSKLMLHRNISAPKNSRIAILNENGIGGRRGTAPVKEAPAVYGSEKFLFEN